MKPEKKVLVVGFILASVLLCNSSYILSPASATDADLGVSIGQNLVYKEKTKTSFSGRTLREKNYIKYRISNISSDSHPVSIAGYIYRSTSTSFKTRNNISVQLALVESFAKVGNLIINKNSFFEDIPSEIPNKFTQRLMEEGYPELTVNSTSIESYDILAAGLGYNLELLVKTNNGTTRVSSIPYVVDEYHVVMMISVRAFYSTTGICLREDISATLTAYSQKYIISSGVRVKFENLESNTWTASIQQHIVPSLSRPKGVSERPWISSFEWILMVLSGAAVMAVMAYIPKWYAKKKNKKMRDHEKINAE